MRPRAPGRYVYVAVHADGPTRVLCFSEAPDEYARSGGGAGGGDTLDALAARLERAQQRIRARHRCRCRLRGRAWLWRGVRHPVLL